MAEAIPPISKRTRLAVKLAAAWWLLGMLPMLINLFGVNFIPSTDWMSKTTDLARVSGVGTIFSFWWLCLVSPKFAESNKYMKIFFITCSPLLSFPMGEGVIYSTAPMAVALVAGEKTEQEFTVHFTNVRGSKFCRSNIDLEGNWGIFGTVCNVPEEIMEGLAPGKRIALTGRGTSIGLIAYAIRRID